jgi:hypothetical protein
VTMTAYKYEVTARFKTARRLTDSELRQLLERIELEISEPSVRDEDGLPTDADWFGRSVRSYVFGESMTGDHLVHGVHS